MAVDFHRYRWQYEPAWRMDHEIGHGGFGVVYKEQIRRPGMFRSEVCAVKKIPLGIVNLVGDLQRYKREIKILASLVHNEWFVQLVGWYETKDSVFIAMEYMELGDLGRHLKAPWSENDSKIVAQQLLKGLAVLHEAGIAHRDLKPQNVFPILLDDGCLRIKIGDFGVSKSVTSNNTSFRTVISVPGYTAPEVMGGPDSYTNAVDLWSLGCLVYRMICGEDLFRNLDDIYRYKYHIQSFPRPKLSALGLSHNAVDFMESLLQSDPQHRPRAEDSLSSSWISTGALGNILSPSQVDRLLNREPPPGDSNLGYAETAQPQLGHSILENADTTPLQLAVQPAPQLVPEASRLGHSLSSHTGDSNAKTSGGDRSDSASSYGADAGKLWNPSMVACQEILKGHSRWVYSVAFSPNGKHLASASSDKTIKLWEPSTGARQATLTGHSSAFSSVAFSPDGKRLASGGYDNNIRLWDPSTGVCRATLQGHSDTVNSVVFSPDGKRLASGANEGTTKLWDLSTKACLATLEGHSKGVYSIAFSPKGNLLASSSRDHTIRLWDPSTNSCLATLKGHSDEVGAVAFSPDGKYLASGAYDKTVKLWDPFTGVCRATLKGHSALIFSVTFSPEGRHLASGAYDKTIKLWDPSTGACQATLEGHSDWVYSVAFSPDGTRLASASRDTTIRLWGSFTANVKVFGEDAQ